MPEPTATQKIVGLLVAGPLAILATTVVTLHSIEPERQASEPVQISPQCSSLAARLPEAKARLDEPGNLDGLFAAVAEYDGLLASMTEAGCS